MEAPKEGKSSLVTFGKEVGGREREPTRHRVQTSSVVSLYYYTSKGYIELLQKSFHAQEGSSILFACPAHNGRLVRICHERAQ